MRITSSSPSPLNASSSMLSGPTSFRSSPLDVSSSMLSGPTPFRSNSPILLSQGSPDWGRFFKKVSKLWRQIFPWGSCFCNKEEDVPGVELRRVQGGERRKNLFRLFVCGQSTKNAVEFSSKCVSLKAVTIHDEDMREEVADMIFDVMEREGIEVVDAPNLDLAYCLWRADLKTDAKISFVPGGSKPLDKFVTGVLKEAFRLGKQTSTLNSVKSSIVLAIITNDVSALPEGYLRRIQAIERLLSSHFDLADVKENVEKNDWLRNTVAGVMDLRSSRAQVGEIRHVEEVEIPLSDLFTLMEVTKTKFKSSVRGLPIRGRARFRHDLEE